MAKKQIEQTEIEAPYELPKGWKWVRFRDICNVYGRIGFRGYTKDDLVSEGEGAISLSPSNMKDMKLDFSNCTYISWKKYEESPEIMLEVGDVVVVKTASVGRTAYVDYLPEKTTLNPQIMVLKNISVNHKLVNYYLNTIYAVQMIQKLVNGTAIPTFSQEKFLNEPFPLPPTLEEQQRIVSRIETLFAKLDQAKVKAQNVVDSFESRKASILHKAFTGELTKKWREENGVGDDSWEEKTIGEIVSGFKYGISDKCDYNNKGIPVLRIPNIDYGFIDYSDLKFADKESVEENYYVKKNDILIIRSNGSRDLVGKSALSENNDEKYTYGSFLIKITPSEIVNPRYLVIFLNSKDARNQMFSKAKSSSGIHNINSKELSIIGIKICSLPEQTEIVRILDTILEKENKAKEAAEAVLEQIELLKKSILARAFRGKI